MTLAFIEKDCIFEMDGKSFESGGSWLLVNKKTGLLGGILYAFQKENKIGSWNGKLKINAVFGNEWYSNFGDKRQTVKFEYKGKKFTGTYYKSAGDLVRVKEVKKN